MSESGPSKKSFIGRTLDGFVNLAARLGINADNQFGAGGYDYGQLLSRNRTQLEAAYRSNWLTGQVVDAIAEDMTREGAEMVCDTPPEDLGKINRAIAKMKIWQGLCQTIKWARLYGGALAVMLIDGQGLNTPLRIDTVRKDQFKGLLVLDRWLVEPSVSQPIHEFGPDMGMPTYYRIVGDSGALPHEKVHHSRLIRLDGIELPYYQRYWENLWGESVVERMHDRMLAYDGLSQSIAQLVYVAYLRVIGVKGYREALSSGGKIEEAVIKQFEYIRAMQGNTGMTILDSEDEFKTFSYSFSGLPDLLLQFGQQISGCTGIPLVRLFGQSPAGLNSTGESDLRNYYDKIKAGQKNTLAPPLEQTLYPVLFRSVLGSAIPEGFELRFNPLWQLSEKERAEISETDGRSVSTLQENGTIDRPLALKELKQSSRITGRFSNITDEMITEAENEPPVPRETELPEPEPKNGNGNGKKDLRLAE